MLLDEVSTTGGVKYRLQQTDSGKPYIELWSSLSDQWRITCRYNVLDEWNRIKIIYARINGISEPTADDSPSSKRRSL